MNEATLENLRRKAAFVDEVQLRDGKPLPSWIDLNITERCNRSAGSQKACAFCPRIDPAFYPNQNLSMGLGLAGKIAGDLKAIDYRGAVVLCGFGAFVAAGEEGVLAVETDGPHGPLDGIRVHLDAAIV